MPRHEVFTWSIVRVLFLLLCFFVSLRCIESLRTFKIENNRFVLDGSPINIYSGSLHYHRIHPAYWRDRMRRLKAMGLNAIQFLVPWNWHEPYPGDYRWSGWHDLPRYLRMAQEEGLLVLLRPGPYICGEWDNGGFPAWLATSQTPGGRSMKMRTDDPAYLTQVTRWWRVLFAAVKPLLYHNGGPVVMVQLENEYGFCAPFYDPASSLRYMRHLKALARQGLGEEVVLYTTDPPYALQQGSLPGDEVYSVVDFGANWGTPDGPWASQAAINAPGLSPPFNSEFYTGWLTAWGEHMANTSMESLSGMLVDMLSYANSSGSFSLYMAHGGTNFGFTAGGNLDGQHFKPCVTSYDYDSPISEAGDYGQPGMGGTNKFEAIRSMVQQFHSDPLPPAPPRPLIRAWGQVSFGESAVLMEAVEKLAGGSGIRVDLPDVMEEYGQRWGVILYRTHVAMSALMQDALLDLGAPVADFAKVLVNGVHVASSSRSHPHPLLLPAMAPQDAPPNSSVRMDVLVMPMGHTNFGCDKGWDHKGLASSNVTLNGVLLHDWLVFPMELEDLGVLAWTQEGRDESAAGQQGAGDAQALTRGPVFFRGSFVIPQGTLAAGNNSGYLPDTFLSTAGWSKGVAWVNGFNLGWYWPALGPQVTLYIPGPELREGDNELIMLEMDAAKGPPTATLVDVPNFSGAAPVSHPPHQGGMHGFNAREQHILHPLAMQPAAYA